MTDQQDNSSFEETIRQDRAEGRTRSPEEYRKLHPDVEESVFMDALGATETATGLGRTGDGPEVGRRIGDYEIIRVLGRGGQGVVYLTHDRRLGREVALKLLTGWGAASEKSVARFHREAEITARLDHPGICTVYESGVVEEIPFLAIQFVKGSCLANRISQGTGFTEFGETRPLNETSVAGAGGVDEEPVTQRRHTGVGTSAQVVFDVVELIEKVARALHVAHEQGVIHRDIKPGNIMVTPEGEPVILDFGIARESDAAGTRLTMTGEMFGTPAFISPEQLLGRTDLVDRRTDIWALGVTLFECLVGERPFAAPTRDALYNSILYHAPTDIRQLNPSLPQELKIIVETALEKDLGARYESALALADDLRCFREHRPIAAKPVGPLGRSWRWAKRNRVSAALLATVFILLVAGILVSTSLLGDARIERDDKAAALRDLREETDAKEEALLHATAIKDFLNNDVLGRVSPTVGSKDVSVRSVLDRASETIGTKFKDSPLIEADIRYLMGQVYCELGELEVAEKHLKRAIELQTRELGGEHSQTLSSMNQMSIVYVRQERSDNAHRMISDILEIQRRALGPKHEDTLNTLNTLGVIERSLGRLEVARPIIQEALEGNRAVLGERHSHTLSSLGNLASYYKDIGDFDQAISVFRELLELRTETMGVDHPVTLKTANALVACLMKNGELKEAESLAEETLASSREIIGPRHGQTLVIMNNLASIYISQNRLDRATGLLTEMIAIQKEELRVNHPHILTATNNLANVFQKQGKLDEAERLYRKALDARTATQGDEHPKTLTAMNNLGSVLQDKEDYKGALALFEHVVEIRKRTLGENHPSTLNARNNVASCFIKLKEYSKAEAMLLIIVSQKEKTLGSDSLNTLVSLHNLGAVRGLQGHYAQALKDFERVVSGRQKHLSETHPMTVSAKLWQIDMLTKQKSYRLAEEKLLELQKQLRAMEKPNKRTLKSCATRLANVRQALKQ